MGQLRPLRATTGHNDPMATSIGIQYAFCRPVYTRLTYTRFEGQYAEGSSVLLGATKHHHHQRHVETSGVPSEAASITFRSSFMPIHEAHRCRNDWGH
jgi:hypothetical protein